MCISVHTGTRTQTPQSSGVLQGHCVVMAHRQVGGIAISAAFEQAFAATERLWDVDAWRDWCAEQRSDNTLIVAKPQLMLQEVRAQDVIAVQRFTAKRPAAALKKPAAFFKRPAARTIKRTPFTLKREGMLITGGVKCSILKKGVKRSE